MNVHAFAPARVRSVAFHVPHRSALQARFVAQAMESGSIRPDGAFSRRAAAAICDMTGARQVVLTHSCTGALELAAIALGILPGDEVIVPSFTFCSTAAAFERAGARIIFCDIDPATLMIDTQDLARRVTARTRAIVPVHYGGASAEIEAVMAIADAHGIAVVEDAAQAFGSHRFGRAIGTHGHFAAYSFHETKAVSCGQGGALVVNTDDAAMLARLAEALDRGTDFAAVKSGARAFYNWTAPSAVFRLGELEAAVLAAELAALDGNLGRRREIADILLEGLRHIDGMRLIETGADTVSNRHVVGLMLEREGAAARLIAHLAGHGFDARQHYEPLHLSPRARAMGYGPGRLPGAEHAWHRLVRLPLHTAMSDEDARACVAAVRAFAGA